MGGKPSAVHLASCHYLVAIVRDDERASLDRDETSALLTGKRLRSACSSVMSEEQQIVAPLEDDLDDFDGE